MPKPNKEDIVMQIKLPSFRMNYGKKGGTRLILLNQVIPMNHHKLKQIHDDLLQQYGSEIAEAFKRKSWGHGKEDTYTVSLGFRSGQAECSGRRTGSVDMDGFGYILKVAIDALVKNTSIIDDSMRYITETRIVYLGAAEHEQLILQVHRN